MSGTIPHVRETATFMAQIENGELAQYRLLLGELRDGRGYVFLMELPWGAHETERFYDDLAEACEAADTLYQLGQGAGIWRIQRYGWQRPTAPGTAGSAAASPTVRRR